MKANNLILAALCAAALCVPTDARANAPAKIKLASNPDTILEGTLRWVASTKEYVFTRNGSTIDSRYKPEQIIDKQVTPPAGIAALANQARGSTPDQALPGLLKIVDDYKMLNWDIEASAVAAYIYALKNNNDAIIKLAEKVCADNSAAAVTSKLAPYYWEALIKTGKTAGGKLNKWLDDAVATAPAAIAAKALITRGDILKKENRAKDALKDGYLRVALLYMTEKDANAEALYKASVAFDELGQTPYAEKMRQRLIATHKNSPWVGKLQGGK